MSTLRNTNVALSIFSIVQTLKFSVSLEMPNTPPRLYDKRCAANPTQVFTRRQCLGNKEPFFISQETTYISRHKNSITSDFNRELLCSYVILIQEKNIRFSPNP